MQTPATFIATVKQPDPASKPSLYELSQALDAAMATARPKLDALKSEGIIFGYQMKRGVGQMLVIAEFSQHEQAAAALADLTEFESFQYTPPRDITL